MRATSFITYCLFLSAFFSLAQQNDEKLKNVIKTADSLDNIRNFDQALPYYLTAEKLVESLADSVTLNLIYYKIARSYRGLGKIPDAIEYYEKLELLSNSLKNDSLYAQALHGLGRCYSNRLEFDKAIIYYEKALKIQQEMGDEEAEMITLNGIGGAYFRSSDFETSFKFTKAVLNKSRKINDYKFEAGALNNIGNYFLNTRDYDSALYYTKQSVKVRAKNNLYIPFVLLANIGTIYRRLEKADSAFVYFEKAKQHAIANDNDLNLAKVNFNNGEMHRDLKDYKTSLAYFMKSYDYAKKENNTLLLNYSSEEIAEAYANLGNPSTALQFLREHVQWIDSVYQQATDRKLEEFNIKHNTIQREKKIAELDRVIIEQKHKQTITTTFIIVITLIIIISILIWQNSNKKRLLAQQESLRFKSIIEAEQKERKRIAQDLHDSLGQSIAMVKMQVSALQSSPEEVSKHQLLLQQVDDTYNELRHISHNIMPNTLITLGLIPAIRELITDISSESAPKIQLEHKDDFKALDENRAITLYRIIQEALVNILKHAEATLVIINLEHKNDTLSLYIKDNGKGMDVSAINDHSGMGWKNIYSRAALLSAKIEVTSQPGEGTSIAIELKSG